MKIELRDVLKVYSATRALDRVSLQIDPGQIVALLGPNGAGKTTLLRCLCGLAAPDRGEILFDEEPFKRSRLDLRRRLSFLPDFPPLFWNHSAIDHIALVVRWYEADRPDLEDRVVDLLKKFDLLAMAHLPVEMLSRGQMYKVAFSALAAVDPELWLLDEPFASGMDPHGISVFKVEAREAAARGRTVIYSTQLLDVAERFSDRVCVIHEGTVRAFHSLPELRSMSGSESDVLETLFRQLREETT